MKNSYIIALIASLCIFAPSSGYANAITTQQAKTEHMRACLSNGGKKDICTCSFDRTTQVISVEDLMSVNRALANKIPANDKHLDILGKATQSCAKDVEKGTYVPASATAKPPALPTLPTPPNATGAIALPTPPSFKDLDNLTIPAPPNLEKSAPNFTENDAEEGSEDYFTDTEIDANEDPEKLANKGVPAVFEAPFNVDVADLRDKYQGQHDQTFFEAAARGNLTALTAINQYLKSPDIIDRFGNTPLIIAVQNGQTNAASFLLANGANPNFQNKNGQAPLHIAVFKRRQDIALLLLRNKANVNLAYGTGFTPLILALMNADETMLQTLIVAGADIKFRMADGNLPIHVATSTDNARTLQILKNYGADLNAENAQAYTPLMVAASQNKVTAASALLALGADFNRTDIYGRTAAQIAYSLGHQQIVNLALTMQEKQRGGY